MNIMIMWNLLSVGGKVFCAMHQVDQWLNFSYKKHNDFNWFNCEHFRQLVFSFFFIKFILKCSQHTIADKIDNIYLQR